MKVNVKANICSMGQDDVVRHYLDMTRLVEGEKDFTLWHQRKVVWTGPCKEHGEAWARVNRIKIEHFERFDP
jgi:hypothetical protein